MSAYTDTFVTVAGCRTRVLRGGEGPPLLFLHGASGGGRWLPFMARLARRFDVIAPEHPGFGQSADPPWLDAIGDLAYFYLDLLRALDLRGVHLVGTSMGGWIAAELAVRSTEHLKTLTLVCAVGVLAEGRPIEDIMRLPPDEHARRFCPDEASAQASIAVLRLAFTVHLCLMSHDESLHTTYSFNLYKKGDFQHTPLMHGPVLFHMTALMYFFFGDSDFSARLYPAIMGVC
jgi:pimeloyl-ACP methyl ester carboxylesterase